MFFDSTAYVVFLSFVTLLYWRLPFRKQNYLLLAASYVFYGWWDWRFLLLMAGSTLVDFIVARKIASTSNERTRRSLLFFSIILNFAFLGIFKYFNFFLDSTVHLAALLGLKQIPVSLWRILFAGAIGQSGAQAVRCINRRAGKDAGGIANISVIRRSGGVTSTG